MKMLQQSLPSLSSAASDTILQQAIVVLKKGAHLLKYGSRGKPKFCPFKLSTDEKFLMWYSGNQEKKLKLATVTNIIQGLQNPNKHLQLEKENLCVSLIYGNGKCCLQLIFKDKIQAECWFMGLRGIIARNNALKKQRGGGAHSCITSPAAFIRRKHVLGLSEVHSLSGSPPPSFSFSSDSFHSASTRSTTQRVQPEAPILKDIYVWGEGADSPQPKLVESTMSLDVRTLSLGRSHVAVLTEQGDVFRCGDLTKGTIVNQHVDPLTGIRVKHVCCNEIQTWALTVSGECYTLSDNDYLPRRLGGVLDDVVVSGIACGDWHVAIVSECGSLFSYGDGTFGALGHGNLESYKCPKRVESVVGSHVQHVACGPWHTAAVIGGKLFTWGDADKGRLGHPGRDRKLVPTRVEELSGHDFVAVSCGDLVTVGLTATGRVYSIGAMVAVLEIDEFVVQVSCGWLHGAVLTSNGNVYSLGRDRSSVCLVESLKGRKVEKIVCGWSWTAVICGHKFGDDLCCRGCGNVFGFTRKKHKCCSCGRLFCRSCSSKTSASASNESKPFRICNGCSNHLQKVSFDDPSLARKLDFNIHVDKVLPRWGRVSCPQIFCDVMEGRDSLSLEWERHLSKEILRLKAQIDKLEEQCGTRDEKIKENHRKIEEARLVAKEQSLKCEEANQIVQELTSKLCEMQEYKTPSSICSGEIGTKVERVEEYTRGVFVTLAALPHGKTALKRVRFSRKIFNDGDAKTWWDQNQESVYRECGIHVLSITNTYQTPVY